LTPILEAVSANTKRGQLIADIAPDVEGILNSVSFDTKKEKRQLLEDAAPAVGALVPGVTTELGPIVEAVSTNTKRGQLIADIAPDVAGILNSVSFDTKKEKRQLLEDAAPAVAALIPGVTTELGPIVEAVSTNTKRGQLIADAAPYVGDILTSVSDDTKA
jgi:hypothetical protein